jgi:hypothetical protein
VIPRNTSTPRCRRIGRIAECIDHTKRHSKAKTGYSIQSRTKERYRNTIPQGPSVETTVGLRKNTDGIIVFNEADTTCNRAMTTRLVRPVCGRMMLLLKSSNGWCDDTSIHCNFSPSAGSCCPQELMDSILLNWQIIYSVGEVESDIQDMYLSGKYAGFK